MILKSCRKCGCCQIVGVHTIDVDKVYLYCKKCLYRTREYDKLIEAKEEWNRRK